MTKKQWQMIITLLSATAVCAITALAGVIWIILHIS